MKNKFTEQDLADFEKDIADNYSEGKIRAPVHLTGSIDRTQEKKLIDIFKEIKSNDWVFSTHRSHYHALLKSNNPKWVKQQILDRKSINIHSKKYKFFTSAIVGGNLPIALGVAMALKRKKSKNKVWCFIGDMAANMGVTWECLRYAIGNELPFTLVVEDNGIGCYTPTNKVWKDNLEYAESKYLIHYKFKRKYPHYGIGKWITF